MSEHAEDENPNELAALARRIPWEDPGLSWAARISGTLAATFKPNATVDAIAGGTALAPALSFALIFAVPFMALFAIPPFTHTLNFKPGLLVEVITQGGRNVILADIAQAVGIGIAMGLVSLASWVVPFASLLRAFCARPELTASAPRYALRLMLYRAWLIPCGLALHSFALWAAPETMPQLFALLTLLLLTLPRVLLLLHTFALTRHLGIHGGATFAVTLVPVAVAGTLGMLLSEGVPYLLPPTPEAAPHAARATPSPTVPVPAPSPTVPARPAP